MCGRLNERETTKQAREKGKRQAKLENLRPQVLKQLFYVNQCSHGILEESGGQALWLKLLQSEV